VQAQAKGSLAAGEYREAMARGQELARVRGLDATFATHRLEAIVAPSVSPPWTIDLVNGHRPLGSSSQPAAMAGYPVISVPAGLAFGQLPVGITLMGRAGGEERLLGLAHALEQATRARRPPQYLATLALAR